MCKIPLPAVFNDYPTRSVIKEIDGIMMVGIALKVARNIHIRCRLGEAQNWKCCWCGIECRPEPNHKDSATIEHVEPRSLGGGDHWDNYAMACAQCNHRRGTLSIEDFMSGKIAIGDGQTAQRNQHERNQDRRFRKYRRHVEKFNAYNWKRNDRPYCPEEWLASLKITECRREKLREMIVV